MYTKVNGEQQVQILSPNFSISPSNEDYVLNISANGRDFSPLFAVSAGVTRLVSNVAPGSYYKLVGNQSEVVINWQRMCATEGGSFDPSVLDPYWTSAETQSVITAVEDHLFEVEEVTATALTELHDNILELSGSSVDLSAYYTSAQTEEAISAATAGKADASNITGGLQPVPTFGDTWFPVWNKQGIITGTSRKGYIPDSYFNGKKKVFVDTNGNGGVTIYGPESVGTAGDILVSTGNGAPVWSAMTFPTPDVDKTYVDSAITGVQDQIDVMDEVVATSLVDLNTRKVESTSVHTIWKGTQAEYDAIATKDPATLYIIL